MFMRRDKTSSLGDEFLMRPTLKLSTNTNEYERIRTNATNAKIVSRIAAGSIYTFLFLLINHLQYFIIFLR